VVALASGDADQGPQDAQLDRAWAQVNLAQAQTCLVRAAAHKESALAAYLAATPEAVVWYADRAAAAAAYELDRQRREAILATFVNAVGPDRVAVDAAFADAADDARRAYTTVQAALSYRRGRFARTKDAGRRRLWEARGEANVEHRDAQRGVRVARDALFVAEANDQDAARAVLDALGVLSANPSPSNGGHLATHAAARSALDDACNWYNETADQETHLGEQGERARHPRLRGEPLV